MNKISLKIDLLKIDKSKIKDEEYTDRDGNVVKRKIYSIDVIPIKEKKFVKDGDTWTLYKTHFGVETQTKEERNAKEKSNFIAEGFTFESKEDNLTSAGTKVPDFSEVDEKNSDVPF